MLQKRPDYFLLHPPRQPKREIAEYVGSHPALFEGHACAKKAVANGKRVRARSEHRQDYAGVSGMVDSPLLNDMPNLKDEKELKDIMRNGEWTEEKGLRIGSYELEGDVWVSKPATKKLVRSPTKTSKRVEDYFNALRLGNGARDAFWNGLTFSYWEELGGYNLTIIADSAIANKHHIMVRNEKYHGYLIFMDGKAVYESKKAPSAIIENGHKIIDFYEIKRNMSRFDPMNCLAMEAQFYRAKSWFLQFLRGQMFEPAGFKLERKPEKGELVALHARGATAPGGGFYILKLYDGGLFSSRPQVWRRPFPHEDKADGTIDLGLNTMLRELSLRQRQVNIRIAPYGLDSELGESVTHEGISGLFKPKISLIFSMDDWPKIEAKISGGTVPAWIESDGNRAIMKLL